MNRIHMKWIMLIVLFVSMGSLSGQTQSVKNDSTSKATNNSIPLKTVKQDTVSDEIVLDEIFIQGKIDKPAVIIVPKRVEPDLKEVELERSFKKELKEGVGDILQPEKELRKVDQVKSIKKAIERDRRKKKN